MLLFLGLCGGQNHKSEVIIHNIAPLVFLVVLVLLSGQNGFVILVNSKLFEIEYQIRGECCGVIKSLFEIRGYFVDSDAESLSGLDRLNKVTPKVVQPLLFRDLAQFDAYVGPVEFNHFVLYQKEHFSVACWLEDKGIHLPVLCNLNSCVDVLESILVTAVIKVFARSVIFIRV